MVPALEKRIRNRILQQCESARAEPNVFASPHDDALWDRYQAIGLEDARHMQFESLCGLPRLR